MLGNFKNTFIGDRHFYKKVILLVLPMIFQNAVTSFVSLLDNIMVGQIGTEQMTGVAIVNQLIFVFNIAIFGGVSGAGIFGTQFFGKNDHTGHKYTFRFKIYVCTVISLVAYLLFKYFPKEIISLYLSDSGEIGDVALTLKYAEEYLYVMLISLLPFAIGQAYVSTMRETGQSLVPMISSVIAVLTNLVLDYAFIFGKLGFPEMGVKGAAIATVIAKIFESVIVVVWVHLRKNENKYIIGAYKSFRVPKNICKDILIKGTPLMANEMIWAIGFAVITQCYAVRGLEALAAYNIASTIGNLFNIVYIQIGVCISIMVGQYLGAGKLKEAKEINTKLIFFAVSCCIVLGIIMIMLGGLFPKLYNTEPQIKALARTLIIITAAVMPVHAFTHSAYFTLRSGGKTGITFMLDSVYSWVFWIPVAYVLANFTTLSIEMVYLIVQLTEFVKATIGFFLVKSDIWLNTIVE